MLDSTFVARNFVIGILPVVPAQLTVKAGRQNLLLILFLTVHNTSPLYIMYEYLDIRKPQFCGYTLFTGNPLRG